MNINSIVERISANAQLISSGKISDIERDILLADLRELYILVKSQAVAEKAVMPVVSEIKVPVVSVIEKMEVPVVSSQQAEVIEPVLEKHESPVVIEAVITAPIITGVVEEVKEDIQPLKQEPVSVVAEVKEEKPIIVEKKEEPIPQITNRIHYEEGAPMRGPKGGSLNEVFIGEERSINSLTGSGEKKRSLNDQIHRKDMKGMIDFNKQHVLTNELFHGDSAAFQSAINHINDSPTIESAFEYIKTELLPKYKWSGEMQSTRLFDKLVRQKFGV